MTRRPTKPEMRPAPAKGSNSGSLLCILGAVGVVLAVIISYGLSIRPLLQRPAAPISTPPTAQPSTQPSSMQSPKASNRDRPGGKRSRLDHGKTEVVGNRTLYPSFGLFPKGCKWRPVSEEGKSGVEYLWWHAETRKWVEDRPEACSPTGHAAPGPPGWSFNRGTPRTEVTCDQHHCMYTNLYYNLGRWYALVDGPNHVPTWRFSRNQEIVTFHVEDAWDFVDSIKWSIIPGDTILFDFIYFIHPTAIGHWWEMLGPLYSTLKKTTFKRPVDQFILLHLQRRHVLEWVRAMIAVALGVAIQEDLPPIYVQEPSKDAWDQITSQLEGLDRDTWYIFEKVAITKDLYTGGGRTFLNNEDAREFRGLIYQQYGLPPPQPWSPNRVIPHTITYQRKRANRRILNEEEFIEMLKEFGDVKVVEYNESSSLYEQLLQMRDTGVFISVHTSNLANAPLLQPGSAVVEILQRNWHWNGLDTSFRDQTMTMGDIHHYAWRAQRLNETFYLHERDFIKVAHWPPEECGTEECVEAHTKVDVKVDLHAFRALLAEHLPVVWKNTHPYYHQVEWPPCKDLPE